MSSSPSHPCLPVELVFNPNWWNKTAGISFDRSFYLDPQARIENDVLMRKVLHQRYGDLTGDQLGEVDQEPPDTGFVVNIMLLAVAVFSR